MGIEILVDSETSRMEMASLEVETSKAKVAVATTASMKKTFFRGRARSLISG